MKEPFWQSVRFWTMLAGSVVAVIATFVDLEAFGVSAEELQGLLVSLAVMVGSFIWGRTKRPGA